MTRDGAKVTLKTTFALCYNLPMKSFVGYIAIPFFFVIGLIHIWLIGLEAGGAFADSVGYSGDFLEELFIYIVFLSYFFSGLWIMYVTIVRQRSRILTWGNIIRYLSLIIFLPFLSWMYDFSQISSESPLFTW